MRVSGREAFTDDTFRMTPCFRSAIGRANTCDGRIVPSKFRLVTACQAASGTSKNRASGVVVARGSLPPAPLTRKSIFPCSPRIRRQASSSAGRSSTSATSARCLPALLPKVPITYSARPWLRPKRTTFAPPAASARAISAPKTPVPPVMTAVRPEKSYDIVVNAPARDIGIWSIIEGAAPPRQGTVERYSLDLPSVSGSSRKASGRLTRPVGFVERSVEGERQGQGRQEAVGGGRDARLGRRIAVGGELSQRAHRPAAGEEDLVADLGRDRRPPARRVAAVLRVEIRREQQADRPSDVEPPARVRIVVDERADHVEEPGAPVRSRRHALE